MQAVPRTRTGRRGNRESSKKALQGLIDVAGVPAFRPDQLLAIVSCAIHRCDTWLQLACSAGKTLVFAMVLLLFCQGNSGAIGIFVSPMETSIAGTKEELERFGIHVIHLTPDTRDEVVKLLQAGCPPNATVILGNPKQLKHPAILNAIGPSAQDLPDVLDYKNLPVSPVKVMCVDEAHCVAGWSHDFLHSFNKLSRLVLEMEKWPCGRTTLLLAMTATATKLGRQWIMKNLRFQQDNIAEIVRDPRRPNALWRVHVATSLEGNTNYGKSGSVMQRLFQCVLVDGHVTLVFVNSRSKAESLAKKIQELLTQKAKELDIHDWSAEVDFYHSKVEARFQKKLRNKIQSNAKTAFQCREKGQIHREGLMVMVCTISFGMSISIPNIDRCLMLEHPSTLQNAVQQGLRSGRAGTPCEIDLYISWKVHNLHLKNIRKNGERAQEEDLRTNGTFGRRGNAGNAQRGLRDDRLRNSTVQEESAIDVMKMAYDSKTCRNEWITNAFEPGSDDDSEDEGEQGEEEGEEGEGGRCKMTGNCGWCDVCLNEAVDLTAADECKTSVLQRINSLNPANGLPFEDCVRGVRQNFQPHQKKFNLMQIATCVRELILKEWLREGACSNTTFGVARGVKWRDALVQQFLEGNDDGNNENALEPPEKRQEQEETTTEEQMDADANELFPDDVMHT